MRYDADWQANHRWTQQWSWGCFVTLLHLFEKPKTLPDMGCGEGHIPRGALQLGIDALGSDMSIERPALAVFKADLTKPLRLSRISFDWVISWEVAEHLPASAADTYCESLARHVGTFLFFTAATPGQGGDGHINEQPHAYWVEKLGKAGLILKPEMTEMVRHAWEKIAGPCWWYPQNLRIFARRERQERSCEPSPPSISLGHYSYMAGCRQRS